MNRMLETKMGKQTETMKAEEKNYFNIHAWLLRKFGNAKMCEGECCSNTKPKRFEWALKKGCKYERNRENFIQLCCSCHRKYDMTDAIREKMSLSAKKSGRLLVDNPMKKGENRLKASVWMTNRVVTDNTKRKQSDRLKGKKPPFLLNGTHCSRVGGNNSAARKVMCEVTGVIFETVSAAAEYAGLNLTTLVAMLKGQNRNKTTLRYA